MKLWIVGEYLDGQDAWTFCGVFDSEERAVAACRDRPRYFVGPAELNDDTIPQETVDWAGAYYPAYTETP